MRKERIPEIERLRGLAFLAVVLQHSIAHYSVEEGMGPSDGVGMAAMLLAVKFAVPAFIFITGLVLFYNDPGKLNYGTFVRKRVLDIYVPFAVWTIIHMAMNRGLHPGSLDGWADLGLNLLSGKASSHLWYIIMLFQFYLLYPLFRSALLGISRRFTLKMNVILLMVAGGLYVLMTDHITDIGSWMGQFQIPIWSDLFTTYADRNALFYSFYFMLGAAAGMNQRVWQTWIRKARPFYWPLFFFLFGFLLMRGIREILSAQGAGITFYSLSLLRPWMAVFLICSIFVVYDVSVWICRHGGPVINRLLSSLGLYSFGAYLMHLLTLRISYLADEAWFAAAPSWARILFSWGIGTMLAYAGARLISLLPFGKWLAGVPGGRSRKRRMIVKTAGNAADM